MHTIREGQKQYPVKALDLLNNTKYIFIVAKLGIAYVSPSIFSLFNDKSVEMAKHIKALKTEKFDSIESWFKDLNDRNVDIYVNRKKTVQNGGIKNES